ncbi:MAG: 50S ribosomal protein L21e [Candidatus Altiarchaeales archaeon]|nr:MAG: 50S ribosomal protein L21e [Candidatus Altiarchaeales archaeon]RLI94386.1 MAG: 50S ribosomal protein L21e [Candidatus Altiarchaeales archaeon]RLI94463.1 MAG: 50S ribosomal protein L21e [Candidatus Altiarchaeales archaeon]HDO82020.1 50S ribosomal protein L21e [Candidatus Altiarchaeales archaeon]HEX54669.1 50S ribosomal protein L21e [Candidatus Altiarchaeales archaeon]
MKGSKGMRRRTRNFRVRPRDRGKISIRRYLQRFDNRDTVIIDIDPRYQNIPHPRFHGRTGRVIGSQGRAYYVEVRDGNKIKKVLVTPEHLRPIHS